MVFNKNPPGTSRTVLDLDVLGESVTLSDEEKLKVDEAFQAYDYDKSGCIDKTELADLLIELKWFVEMDQLDKFANKHFGPDTKTLKYDQFMVLYKALLAKQSHA